MYNIKAYSKDGAFRLTLSPSQIEAQYTFSHQKDVGRGDFNFVYHGSGISHDDVIKIYKEGVIVYQGFVDGITRVINNQKSDSLQIQCTGMMGYLAYVEHEPYRYRKQTPKQILTRVFGLMADAGYHYDLSGIEDIDDTITLNIKETTTCKSVVQMVINHADVQFGVRDKVYVWKNPTTHIFGFQKHITSIEISESSRDIINDYTLEEKSGATAHAQDTQSIASHGKRAKKLSYDMEVTQAGLETIVQRKLSQTSQPTLNAKVIVNGYDTHNLMPGDSIIIRGVDSGLDNKIIHKIIHTPKHTTLLIDGVRDLGSAIADLKKT